jgi:hypothetical protein
MSVVTFLLALVLSAMPAYGGDVYLYDDSVVGEVDIGRFTTKGEVAFLTGIAKFCDTQKGPAPAPYPQINIWEPDYEHLGASTVEMDGILFINLGSHWVKGRKALVLWKIIVPNAGARMVSEFDEDLTLSMWVDWDLDEMWDKNELVIRSHFNIGQYMPTSDETMCFYYLTSFRVPDVNEMMSPNAWWDHMKNKEILRYWVRGTIACDDGDVSPDGDQLFGEAEDYRVSYMVMTKQKKEN